MEHTEQNGVTTEFVINENGDIGTNTKVEVPETSTTETKDELENKDEVKVHSEVKDEVKKDIMIPKERFDEVNSKYKELAGQLEEMQKAKEEMESQLAEMKKESESTNTAVQQTTEKLESQVKQYETLVTEMVETKIQAIPEDMKELVPDGLTVEQKLAWLNKAEEKGLFKKEEKPKVVVGQPLNHSANQDKAETSKRLNPIQLLTSYYGGNK